MAGQRKSPVRTLGGGFTLGESSEPVSLAVSGSSINPGYVSSFARDALGRRSHALGVNAVPRLARRDHISGSQSVMTLAGRTPMLWSRTPGAKS